MSNITTSHQLFCSQWQFSNIYDKYDCRKQVWRSCNLATNDRIVPNQPCCYIYPRPRLHNFHIPYSDDNEDIPTISLGYYPGGMGEHYVCLDGFLWFSYWSWSDVRDNTRWQRRITKHTEHTFHMPSLKNQALSETDFKRWNEKTHQQMSTWECVAIFLSRNVIAKTVVWQLRYPRQQCKQELMYRRSPHDIQFEWVFERNVRCSCEFPCRRTVSENEDSQSGYVKHTEVCQLTSSFTEQHFSGYTVRFGLVLFLIN